MHKLLGDFMTKVGLKPTEMTDEEKATVDQWQAILSDEEVTAEKIAEFCSHMQNSIEQRWADVNRDRKNDTFLADIHNVYGTIGRMITSKKTERISLEAKLQEMLDSPPDSSL